MSEIVRGAGPATVPSGGRPRVLATTLGTALLAAMAATFYRRPFATLRAVVRWVLLARGASERLTLVRGVPVRYLVQGPQEAPALVLLHGLGDSAETWARVWSMLARDYRLIAPDLVGFGRTPLPPEGMSLTVLADYLAGFLELTGLTRVVLVGNSLGGAVAIRFAARHPERVAQLILLDSAAYPLGEPTVLAPTDRATARTLISVSGRPQRVPGFVLDDLVRRTQHPGRRSYLASDEPTDIRADLPQIAAIPTTIVWGERDELIPVATGEYLHDALPNSEFVILPGVGHVPQSEAPAQVVRVVRECVPSR